MKRLLIIIILAVTSGTAMAGEFTGRDIALKMDAVDTSEDSKRTAIMVINRKGQKLVRKMESCNKKYGPDERGLIRFIEPPDVRGLCISPGVMRISSGMTTCGSFFRLKALCVVSAEEEKKARSCEATLPMRISKKERWMMTNIGF